MDHSRLRGRTAACVASALMWRGYTASHECEGRRVSCRLPQSGSTDEILVVAAAAVEAVVAQQQPRPSGKAQYRLLAWTVADARGATAVLDKALAETVGKRLDRQALNPRT